MLPSRVEIVEVGPRDGLQNESTFVPTTLKIELIERLALCGLRTIETTSFVSPKAIPQLADADDVMAGVHRQSDVINFPVLVPNLRGYERAIAAGARSISVFTAASESFSQRNINASINKSIERFKPIVERAQQDKLHVRGYVSTAWGCPFEGPVAPSSSLDVMTRLVDLGIEDISIGDTIGVAVPSEVDRVITPMIEQHPDARIGLHLHDTRGMAIANAWAGLQLGINTFDSSVAGLGGCPFAPGATGNLATEDLVWFLERCGIETGIDLPELVTVSRWISTELNRSVSGHVAAGPRLWPWPAELTN